MPLQLNLLFRLLMWLSLMYSAMLGLHTINTIGSESVLSSALLLALSIACSAFFWCAYALPRAMGKVY